MFSKLKVLFLGCHHPHFFVRYNLIKQRDDVDIVGFWEEDAVLALKLEQKLGMKRFDSPQSLLHSDPLASPDVVFVHSLDHDVPRLALLAAEAGAKGLMLEKPGATKPEHIFKLAEAFKKDYADVIVEFGWEMHYAEVMDVVRGLVRKGTLGDITTSHWHGGTPSGGAVELWQRQDDTLGGFLYEDGSHTLEAIVNVFGLPRAVSASIRKLPVAKEKHPIVSCYYDMDVGELDPANTSFAVGELRYEDIGSVILEYETHNVVAEFTAWEPTDWCEDWGINLYGTNGTFHGVLNPPVGEVRLRTAKDGYSAGATSIATVKETGVSNQAGYYERQVNLFLKRVLQPGLETECSGLNIEVSLMKVLDAIYKSAKERRFVNIE